MPKIRPLVDVEALTIAYLEADAAVAALVAAGDVAAELPGAFPPAGRKFVQAFRASATDTANGHLERVVLQVNAYGSTKVEAFDVIAKTYRALLEMPDAGHDAAVVTDTRRLTGPTWSPDPVTDAPRYTSSFAVTVHPTA